jgi:hypothetical protein
VNASIRSVPLVVAFAVSAGGCSSCHRAPTSTEPLDAGTVALLPTVAFQPPAPWKVEKLPGAGDVALPAGCKFVLPVGMVRAPTDGLTFAAAHGAPAAFAFAASEPDPEASAATEVARGIVDVAFDAKPRLARDVPWWSPVAPPPLAAAGGRWLALVDRTVADPLSRVVLWREGSAPETLGEGDKLASIDFRCVDRVSADLTTRLSRVAAPGASVFVGAPDQPAAEWRRYDVGALDAGTDVRPATIAGIHGDAVDVALLDRDGVGVFRVSKDGVVPGPHLRGHYGVLDVATLAAKGADGGIVALAASHSDPVDENGCSGVGGRVTIERTGHDPAIVRTGAPPLSAFLRPLSDGAIFAWIAPVSCRNKSRPIVHAMLLDATGAPISSDTAVDDASGFAVETRGDAVEMFLRTHDGIKWIRGVCGKG